MPIDPSLMIPSNPDSDRTYTTTTEDFTNFQEWCKVFIKLFGLFSWSIVCDHRDISEEECLALVECNVEGHSARITLSTVWANWDNMDVPLELQRTALHEIIHILLARYQNYAERRDVGPSDLIEALEEAVRNIENVFEVGRSFGTQGKPTD